MKSYYIKVSLLERETVDSEKSKTEIQSSTISLHVDDLEEAEKLTGILQRTLSGIADYKKTY